MLSVARLMQSHPESVSPDLPVTMLERRFLESGFSGYPVVEDGRLVGVVSRYDIVRSMIVERSRAEQVSDFYSTSRPLTHQDKEESLEAIAAQVGVRIAGLTVKDVMIQRVVSVDVSEPVDRVAALMLEGHFRRLPVVSDGQLVGIVTSMDLLRAIADGRLVEAVDAGAGTGLLSEGNHEASHP